MFQVDYCQEVDRCQDSFFNLHEPHLNHKESMECTMTDLRIQVAPGAFQADYESLHSCTSLQIDIKSQKISGFTIESTTLFEAKECTSRQRRKLLLPFIIRQDSNIEIESKLITKCKIQESREEQERQYRQREMERFLKSATRVHAASAPEAPDTRMSDISFRAAYSEKRLRMLALLPPIRSKQPAIAPHTASPSAETATPSVRAQCSRGHFRHRAMAEQPVLRILAALLCRLELSSRCSPIAVSPPPSPPPPPPALLAMLPAPPTLSPRHRPRMLARWAGSHPSQPPPAAPQAALFSPSPKQRHDIARR